MTIEIIKARVVVGRAQLFVRSTGYPVISYDIAWAPSVQGKAREDNEFKKKWSALFGRV